MTMEEIADLAGIKTHSCDEKWGGTYGYSSIGCSVKVNGFKTKEEAIKQAISYKLPGKLGKVCFTLLLKANKKDIK